MSSSNLDLIPAIQCFCEYIVKNYSEGVEHILGKEDNLQHYSLFVSYDILFGEKVDLPDSVLCDSEKIFSLFDEGLILAQKQLYNAADLQQKDKWSVKNRVHVRIADAPPSLEERKITFVRNEDLRSLIGISGTVVKTTLPKVLIYERDYLCSKCKENQTVCADFYQFNALLPPKSCLKNNCANPTFKPVKENEKDIAERYMDYQEIKVQDAVGRLNVGAMPSSIWVTLEHDLVDACHPGDHVTILGTVVRRWRKLNPDTKSEAELVIRANNLILRNDQKSSQLLTEDFKSKFEKFWEHFKNRELFARDHILASFCPQVYGLYLVKLAICVVLCGGLQTKEESGTRVRSESHLLLVGDPGTGKSHLLRFAAKISSRSVLTTGTGTTSAGLTVTAIREGSDWHLEAGALVLADSGICCIDELSSMREHDRACIHEAMEQQTISVAKAGMVTKLNSRCAILAATNPKGKFDERASLSVNVALASPLLSRFDLVLILIDEQNSEWERLVSSYVLETAMSAEPSNLKKQGNGLWTLKVLQSYFALARTLQPSMSASALTVLSKYYQAQRSSGNRNQARTTVRMLESLLRLSQGHAKLMMRNEVTLMDAIVSISLVECSMLGSALISSCNALHTSFPEDPQAQFFEQAKMILTQLNLEDLLSELNTNSHNMDVAHDACLPPVNLFDESSEEVTAVPSQRVNEILTGIRKQNSANINDAIRLSKSYGNPSGRKGKKTNAENKIGREKISCVLENEGVEDRIAQTANAERAGISNEIEKNKGNELDHKNSSTSKSFEKIDDLTSNDATVNRGKRKRIAECSDEDEIFASQRNSKNRGPTGKSCLGRTTLQKLKIFAKEDESCACDLEEKLDSFHEEEILFATPPPGPSYSGVGLTTSPTIPTSLITQPVIPAPPKNPITRQNDGFSRNKLQALARLGKSLSQTNQLSQSQRTSSQFSLKEMSWDDIDLEL